MEQHINVKEIYPLSPEILNYIEVYCAIVQLCYGGRAPLLSNRLNKADNFK